MADQKAMKKRLKALMQRPENQVCSDCPEKRPTWASLIVPPPGAPPGTEKIGSFCCLECSGSHRRLGVHISFVRSVNLDSWKEWEVRAMENGGNARVNAIFEARLAQSGRTKPTHLADGPTRERYIRDKYERRKFYDPAGFATPSSGSGAVAAMPSQSSQSSSVGTPSDIARQRVASRQARMKPAVAVAQAPPPKAAVAQAPVSEPPEFDLLDFGSTATIAASTPSAAPVVDAFAAAPDAFASAPVSAPVPKPSIPPPPKTAPAAPTATTATTLADEFRRSDPPKQPTTKSNDDIMALFGPPKPQPTPQGGFGMHAMNQMGNSMMMNGMMSQQQSQGNNNNMMMMNGMTPQQQPQGNNNMMMNGMTPQQQQQQQQMMMMMQKNNMMMANGNGNQMMSSQMMQQPQQQQQMMMQQQQMMMMKQQQQQQQQMMGNNSNSFGNFHAMNNNNNAMNSLAQGMQTMSMKQNSNSNDDGGFGTPMGGNGNNNFANSDAFSSLGGMNAFR